MIEPVLRSRELSTLLTFSARPISFAPAFPTWLYPTRCTCWGTKVECKQAFVNTQGRPDLLSAFRSYAVRTYQDKIVETILRYTQIQPAEHLIPAQTDCQPFCALVPYPVAVYLD